MRRSVLALAVLLVVGQAVSTTGAGARSVPELAGTTKISGSSTALAHVVIPQPVTISTKPFDNPVATISSTGQLAGVVLKQEVARRAVEVMAFSVDPCDGKKCDQRRLEFVLLHPLGRGNRMTLPAGRYLLYLVSDGAPTDVTLTLPGLDGETSLRPAATARSTFSPLTPWAVGDSAKVAYSASTTHAIKRMGLTLVALEVEADAHIAGDYTSCLRPVPDNVPPTAFELSCSGAVGGWILTHPSGDPGRVMLVGLALEGEGRFVHGVSYETAAAVTAVRSFGFALSYESGKAGGRSFSSVVSFEPDP